LEERLKVLKRANLNPVVVDIEPAALNNQYYLNYPENLATPVCLVDIGASFTKVVISFGGYPYITRNIGLGGINITEHLQKEFMLSFEEAERLKLGEEIREISYEKAFDVVKGVLRRIFTEVVWTLDNFKERFNLEVNSVYLYGGSAKLKGIEDFFKEISGLEVKAESPLNFSGMSGKEEFAVAAGLGIRYRGDEDAKV
jgi:type IV pilus assembly protein PilM